MCISIEIFWRRCPNLLERTWGASWEMFLDKEAFGGFLAPYTGVHA